MNTRSDVIIVGAGITGLLTARELVLAGLRVHVIDRAGIGRESSWAGGGILSPLYPWRYPASISRLAAWSQAYYPRLASALLEETGVDPEWTRSGLLVLDFGEASAAREWYTALPEHLGQLAPPGSVVKFLDAAGVVAAAEPATAPVPDGAVWLPGIAQIRNPRLVRALRLDLERRGVLLTEGAAVTELNVTGTRVQGVTVADGTRFMAPRCLVAAGAWSGGLLEKLGIHLPVRPVRGQIVLYRTRPGTISRVVLGRGRYVIPRRDGHVLAGSTLEEAGFDKSTTAAARHDLQAAAECLIPALADAEIVMQWAGLRPGSPTEVPWLGPFQALEGLFVSTGHYRNGFVLGPASARLVADLILGRPPLVDPTPYRPTPA